MPKSMKRKKEKRKREIKVAHIFKINKRDRVMYKGVQKIVKYLKFHILALLDQSV
jgi:hypothetical protein